MEPGQSLCLFLCIGPSKSYKQAEAVRQDETDPLNSTIANHKFSDRIVLVDEGCILQNTRISLTARLHRIMN